MANELMVDWENVTPAGTAIAFTSLRQVQDYYGMGTSQDAIAASFFSSNPGGTLYDTRDPIGQRPHLLGWNLGTMTVADLQAVNGTLSEQYNGFTYSGNVNLSNVSGTIDQAVGIAATDVAQALNSHRGVVATAMATFTQHTVSFTGSFDKAQLVVNKILTPGGAIVVGGTVSGEGIVPGTNTIIIHQHGAFGGPGEYSMFHSQKTQASGTFTETYDTMTINSIQSGTIEDGLQVIGNGVTGFAPATGINANVAGTGTGVGSEWIINNAPAITGSIPVEFKPPLLGVYEDRGTGAVKGPDGFNAFLDLSVQGEFGMDTNKSEFDGFVTGTAAAALGLIQGEADPPSQGALYESVATFMNKATHYLTTTGEPISYSLINSDDNRLNANIYAWTQTKAGENYTFVGTVPPPPNVVAAHDLVASAPFSEHSVSDTRGFQETSILAARS
jgi:hypothetical protein